MTCKIDIHADDYAYSLNSSKDIIDCIKIGNLDSFSIIPNMKCFDECMKLLYKEIPSFPYLPKISIHLNLVEGLNLSNTNLLSRDGINTSSWGSIFLDSIGGLKKDFKQQLKLEIKSQIEKTDEVIKKCIEIANKNDIKVSQRGLRIDSHVHTHTIPIVFDALCEVIKENKLEIEYIRNPKEPIMPFVKNITLGFKPANLVKNIILNIFSIKIDRYLNAHKIQREYMWGLMMSLKMDLERIKKIFPSMYKKAINKNRDLEILFHPGFAYKEEYSKEGNAEYFKNSNNSQNRKIEKQAIMKIAEIINR